MVSLFWGSIKTCDGLFLNCLAIINMTMNCSLSNAITDFRKGRLPACFFFACLKT